MIKLSVINFKKESRRKLKNIILIGCLIIIILNLRRDYSEYIYYKEINKSGNNAFRKNDIFCDLNGYNFLEKVFVFFDKEILVNDCVINDYENKDKDKEKFNNKLDFLKNNIEILGYLNRLEEVVNLNGIDEFEDKVVEEIVVDNTIIDEKENIVNELNLKEKDKQLLYSNYVYAPKYEINAENSKDIFDVDLNTVPKIGSTKVVSEKNKEDKFNVQIGNVKIRNESKYDINESVLNFDFKLKNKKDIVIYHTHTCESYTVSEKYNYVQTGNYRSTDLSYSVSRVGDVLEFYLKKLNYNVVHSNVYHDYPAYNGSYNRALSTVSNLLKNNSSEIVLDLHRDAIGNNSDYGPSVEINGERVAQLMFVMGTDGGGLKHEKWKDNLKFAVELQEKAEKMYPGLFKPIIVRNARYNQHVAAGAVIIEVGATGNTLEEAEGAMKYLSILLDEYIKEN